MNIDDALFELTVLDKVLGRLLDDQGKRALGSAKADLEAQKRQSKKKGKAKSKPAAPPWRLRVPPTKPLAFRSSESCGYKLQADIYCAIAEPDQNVRSEEHTLGIRVWCHDEKLWFRGGLDAEGVRKRVTRCGGRRVMIRFHFDQANPRQEGPVFHMQAGGKAERDENCWLPAALEIPRFVHQPMDLLLACEFVVRTFFPQDYPKVANEPSWVGALRKAQKTYLGPYYGKIWKNIRRGEKMGSALEGLWNQ